MSYVVLQATAGLGADAFDSQCVNVPIGGGQTRQLCGPAAVPAMNTCDPRAIQAALAVTGLYAGPIDGDLSTQPSTAAIAAILNKHPELPGTWDYAFPSAGICSAVAREYMGFMARKDKASKVQAAKQHAALQSGAASFQTPGRTTRTVLQQAALDAQRGSGSSAPPVTSGDGSNSGYLPGTSPLNDPAYNPPSNEMEAWWNNQSTTKKVLLVGGAAAAIFGLVKLVQYARKPTRMTPNARRGRKPRRRSGRPRGRIIRFRGKKIGRTAAPAKYRKLGFTRASQYAWPQGFMYPIGDVRHTRLAASKFAKWGSRYPKHMRQTIASRLDAAKRRFHVGEYHTR